VIVVLKLPRPVPQLIVHANGIVTAMMTNASSFPSPSPALSLVTAKIDTPSSAETIAKTRAAGAIASRNAALKVVVTDLANLRAYVQQIANTNVAQASVIATDASMQLRKVPSLNKPPLAAKAISTGTLSVVAKATKGGQANDWEYSIDGGKTWVAMPTTTKAKTTITGLQTGATVGVRQRAITKDGAQDWSDPVSAVVT
jgi:hypothetical protein